MFKPMKPETVARRAAERAAERAASRERPDHARRRCDVALGGVAVSPRPGRFLRQCMRDDATANSPARVAERLRRRAIAEQV